MSGLACNSCNKESEDDAEQKLHYKSEWHRYNLKRKIAGVPGVTEALFEARQTVIAQERIKSNEAHMLYSCGICNKAYRSSKAHEQHLKSKSQVLKASSQGTSNGEEDKAIIKQLPPRCVERNGPAQLKGSIDEESEESEESEDEWVEVDSDLASLASNKELSSNKEIEIEDC